MRIAMPGSVQRVNRRLDDADRGCGCYLAHAQLIPEMPNTAEEIGLFPCQLHDIVQAVPLRFQPFAWRIAFDTARDGCSLGQLYRSMSTLDGPVVGVLLVEPRTSDVDNGVNSSSPPSMGPSIIGCFVGCPLTLSHGSHHFYGTSETFVFGCSGGSRVRFYRWAGKSNEEYVISSAHYLGIGGGNDGAAIYLDEEMQFGHTSTHCPTFDSPALVGGPEQALSGRLLHHREFTAVRSIWFNITDRGIDLLGRTTKRCGCGQLTHVCSPLPTPPSTPTTPEATT